MAKYCFKESKKQSFINPYNFVTTSFDQCPKKSIEDVKKEEGYTGVIKCRMYAKTPLAIPDTVHPNAEDGSFPFLRQPNQDKTLMIPGSSIRGTIRSVFETATESCYSTMKDNTLISTRNSDAAQAAYLIRESADKPWTLVESKRYMLRFKKGNSSKNNKNPNAWNDSVCPAYWVCEDQYGKYIRVGGEKKYSGDIVYFEKREEKNGDEIVYKNRIGIPCAPLAGKISASCRKGYCMGMLHLGEPIHNKHHVSIFSMENNDIKDVKISQDKLDKAVSRLKETLKIYRNPSVNKGYTDFSNDGNAKNHHGYAVFERMENRNQIPVWMKKDKENIYLSLAALGRIAYTRTLNDLVGKKAPCRERSDLCPACRLFGMAGKNGNAQEAVGSRVRFSDAVCETPEEKLLLQTKTLLELSSPKPSYIPFYTTDISTTYKDGMPGYDSTGINIRGRKYYWHSDHFEELHDKILKEKEITDRNAKMELLDINTKFKEENKVEFTFDIYFDGITDIELRQLIWVLNFWENDKNDDYCHKIGHGKPLGLGSVKICVESIQSRTFANGSYHVESMDIGKMINPFDENNQTIKELKTISRFEKGKNIRYPYVILCRNDLNDKEKEKTTAAYNWFGENRQSGKKNHEGRNIQHLKKIEKNQHIHPYKIV